jgi:hypothetical protein
MRIAPKACSMAWMRRNSFPKLRQEMKPTSTAGAPLDANLL